jgi:arsenate reductase
MSITIYHNPRCSKSRQTLELLRENGVEPEIVEYMKTPYTAAQIEELLEMLGGIDPRELMRKKETVYKDAGLDDEYLSREELIDAMAQCPSIVERPIVVNGDKAALGRPPEKVLDLL